MTGVLACIDAAAIAYTRYDASQRPACTEIMSWVAEGRLPATTSVLVIEEVRHLEHRGRPPLPAGTARVAAELFPVLLSVAHYEPRLAAYGDRWYRVQNMEAEIIVQRLYLAAAALGLGCHTQLGFRVDAVNALLGIGETPLTSLIQVLIAPSHNPGTCYDYKL